MSEWARLKPVEWAIFSAIERKLRPEYRDFITFHQFFGDKPPDMELRPKSDGKRAPYHLTHFEWVPAGATRRIDFALRDVQRGITTLAALPSTAFTPPPPRDTWCLIECGPRQFDVKLLALPLKNHEYAIVSEHYSEDEARQAMSKLVETYKKMGAAGL